MHRSWRPWLFFRDEWNWKRKSISLQYRWHHHSVVSFHSSHAIPRDFLLRPVPVSPGVRMLPPNGRTGFRSGCASIQSVSYTHLDVYKRQREKMESRITWDVFLRKSGDTMKIGFIGAGKVGFSLGKFFTAGGITMTGYFSRHRESAVEAAAFTNTKSYESLATIVKESDALFLTVPDGEMCIRDSHGRWLSPVSKWSPPESV